MTDNSIYKTEHDKIIEFVLVQSAIDLNKYRDGDGTSPYTTTYWDLNGPKVCVNWCGSRGGMDINTQNTLMRLLQKYKDKLFVEWGGAWFKFIWLE